MNIIKEVVVIYNCEYFKKIINQQLDNELNLNEQAELNDHLLECDICRVYSLNLSELHNRLLSLSAIQPQINILDGIIADVDNIIGISGNDNKSKIFKKNRFKKYGLMITAAAIILILPITLSINNNLNLIGNDDKLDYSMAIQEDSFINTESIAVDDIITGKGTISDGNSVEMDDYGVRGILTREFAIPYIIEIKNNQLIIYLGDQAIFTSVRWADDLIVDYYQTDENEVIYSLFSNDNNLFGSYKIDLLEKTEEKFE